MPQSLRIIKGDFIVKTVLKYGYTDGQVELLSELAEKRLTEDVNRRESDKNEGLPYDQKSHVANKGRYTRDLNIQRRKNLLKRFKKLVRSAETLGVNKYVGERLGLWYWDNWLPDRPAGSFPTGGKGTE